MPDAVTLAPGLCLPLVSLCLPSPIFCDARLFASHDRCCVTLAPGLCLLLVSLCLCGRMLDPVSPSLRDQMPDAVTLAPGCVSRLFACVSLSPQSDARCCDAGSGSSPACLPVSPSLCGHLSPACRPVSPSLCARMPAPGSCLLLVSQSMRSDARCCDAVVSPACLAVCAVGCQRAPGSCLPLVSLCLDARRWLRGCVSRLSLCVSHLPFFVTLAPGSCLPLVSQSLRSDARCCDAVVSPACLAVCAVGCQRAPGSCLPLVSLCLDARRWLRGCVSRLSLCVSHLPFFCDTGSGVVSPACLPVSAVGCGNKIGGKVYNSTANKKRCELQRCYQEETRRWVARESMSSAWRQVLLASSLRKFL